MKKLILLAITGLIMSSCSKQETTPVDCEKWDVLVWYRQYDVSHPCTEQDHTSEMELCSEDLRWYKPKVGKSTEDLYLHYREGDYNTPCIRWITFIRRK